MHHIAPKVIWEPAQAECLGVQQRKACFAIDARKGGSQDPYRPRLDRRRWPLSGQRCEICMCLQKSKIDSDSHPCKGSYEDRNTAHPLIGSRSTSCHRHAHSLIDVACTIEDVCQRSESIWIVMKPPRARSKFVFLTIGPCKRSLAVLVFGSSFL